MGVRQAPVDPVVTAFPDLHRWAGRRVLVTGNSGFKGSWLTYWLNQMGAQVIGLSLPDPPTHPSLWGELALDVPTLHADLCDDGWQAGVLGFEPEVVFHLAAQAIVAEGYRQPARTFDTNVMGTARLLQTLSDVPQLQALIVITTDKVYDPRQAGPHAEQAFLGGTDPYAASKAATELLCGAWPVRSLPLVTARAGNVVGGGDWATDRLVPDLVRAWESGQPLILRDPTGVRPWQHVLEPLRGYLLYAEAVMSGRRVAPAMNFGPGAADMVMVADIVSFCERHWPVGEGFPSPRWETAGDRPYGETGVLTIESDLAEHDLGWRGLLSWQETMAMTLDWYTGRIGGVPAKELVRRDLGAYFGSDGGNAAP